MEDITDETKFNLILQSVLLSWDTISIDSDIEHILDADRNSMYEKFRMKNPEDSDKMIKAKCMAFTIYLLSHMN